MNQVPYGSKPEPNQLAKYRRDVDELKALAKKLNTKFETEMKRTRQLEEDLVLANANMKNILYQNEDLRQMLQIGAPVQHQHTVTHKDSISEIIVCFTGLTAIVGMFLLMLYAVANHIS